MEKISIRSLTEEDFPSFQLMYLEIFKMEMSFDFFKWKYIDNPNNVETALSVYGAFHQNELIGARAIFSSRVIYNGEQFLAAQTGDTMVKENWRGKGVFKQLNQAVLDDLTEKGYKLIFNFPNENSAPGNLKLGWKLVDYGTNHFKIHPSFSFGKREKGKTLTKKGYVVETTELDNKKVTDFISSTLDGTIYQNREANYLLWKYVQKPGESYWPIVIKQKGEIVALFICKPSSIKFLKKTHIVDYVIKGGFNYTVALDLVSSYLNRNGVSIIQTVEFSDHAFKKSLQRNHFMKRKQKANFMVRLLDDQMSSHFYQSNHWHIALGDTDFI
ncbi:GNAT family N-acetyltransferase [Bacillus sp. N1-1]|uniref:GNAT family N-acetyltransferase n=1 Tax=Bacillus sp. N1-1 TaxID=2682541 RepID=UPI0013195E21|nr:GNAT family N-acetyltransferase [Bacillus sp. N1-1]QHA93643.1 GNAT family N-acetyltransferase [Bacillus sp. N1-1]